MSEFGYKAFISYAHADEVFAQRLHRWLESYRVPGRLAADGDQRRLGTVFRDRDELGSAADLSTAITTALASSEYLIVVCSPAAARSRWVDLELQAFMELRDADHILLILSPASTPAIEANIPPAVLALDHEPLAADARKGGDGETRGFLKLVAGLTGIRFDDLVMRTRSRRRKRLALATAAGVALSVLAGGFYWQTREVVQAQQQQTAALVDYLVVDLTKRLTDYAKVGELDAGLTQALNYFGAQPLDEMSADTLEKYQVALIGVGRVRIRQGKMDSALQVFERAAEVGSHAAKLQDDDAPRWFNLARNTYYIGEAYWEMANIPQAALYIHAAMGHAEQAAALAPGEFDYQIEVVFGHNNLGAVYTRQNRYADATRHLHVALKQIDRLRQDFPDQTEPLLEQEVEAVSWLTEITPAMGHFDQAFGWHDKELQLRTQLWESTNNLHHQARLADALGYQAKTFAAVGNTQAALQALARKQAISTTLLKADPDNVFWKTRLLASELLIAQNQFHAGDAVTALDTLAAAESKLHNMRDESRNVENVQFHLAFANTLRAYIVLSTNPAAAREATGAALALLSEDLQAAQPHPIALGHAIKATLIQHLARERRQATQPDLQQAVHWLQTHGQVDTSIYDQATLSLLLYAQGDPQAHQLRSQVLATGYNAHFYNHVWQLLSRLS